MGKEVVVAWRFGIGDDLDAFNVALLVPFAIVNVLAISFQTAFIPTYLQVRARSGVGDAQRLLANATICLSGILLLCTGVTIIGSKIYLPLLAPGFSPAKLQLTFALLCWLAPIPLFAGIGNLWGATLNAKEQFALVAATPIISIVATLLLLFSARQWGAFALSRALLVGAMIEATILGIALHRSEIFRARKWSGFSSDLKRVLPQSGTLMLSNLFASGTGVIGIAMAAQLAAGSVSSLTYANKLVALLTGLAAAALSTVMMPYFAQMIAAKDWQQIRATRKRFLQLTLGASIPLTIVVIVFARPLTSFVFQRGAFAANASNIVAILFMCFALQIPFYVSGAVLSRLLEALQASRSLLLLTFVSFVVCLILTWGLRQKFQLMGIALATSLTYCCSFFMLYFLAERHLQKAQCE